MLAFICCIKILKKIGSILSCYINSITIHSSHNIYMTWFMTHYNHLNIFISSFCKIINYSLIKFINNIVTNNYTILEFEYIFHCDHIYITHFKSSTGGTSLGINSIVSIFSYYDYRPSVMGLRPSGNRLC